MDFEEKLAELGLDEEMDAGVLQTRRRGALDVIKLLLDRRFSEEENKKAEKLLADCSYAELLFVVDRISEIKTLDDLKQLL
ncbi:hypothetical protein SAMN04488692_10730 [Halarsenatibacter silvermanii]|uniref:DUF4351 domain-containing protein n=2 Tax=Halarsenatibacter silvermanii TaxID=321763 RepID=A0A1G9LW72_9FIRM|nr:hypothetical protein SAMN04488692_10730 [Halarsenatibacter silvermanii]